MGGGGGSSTLVSVGRQNNLAYLDAKNELTYTLNL